MTSLTTTSRGRSRSMTTPERSLQQRQDALAQANVIRSRRALLKRDLKARHVDLVDLLNDSPEWLESAKLFDIMLHVPKYGRVKTNRLFIRLRISPSKTIGGLSDRQRDGITLWLRSGYLPRGADA